LGHDKLLGGAGADVIVGGLDDDKLYGGADNDNLDGGPGLDTIDGSTGNDTAVGDTGSDTITGGEGDDQLDGGTANDNLSGDAGNDTIDGGAGTDVMNGGADSDVLKADRGDESLSAGERVEIAVPTDQAQTDDWSCGPNSASRLLRSYGINVSYSTLKQAAQNASIVSKYHLGTPPPVLQDLMKAHKANTQRQSGASFQQVLDLLGQGRPVIALIGWGSTTVPIFEPWSPVPVEFATAPDTLHYICLTGFDKAQQKLFYTDTNGVKKSYTYGQFQNRWNWPGDGAIYAGLSAMGIKKNTILW
jgi:hypothetical protein